MRRELLLLLAVMATVVSMAADVTPQQALQEAQRFVQERAKVSGRRVAATPQLTLVSRVSDLYVFNAADNGGFVIVSNDDCTEAVLGYSDTGAFDSNNIPDNMRGWLQGYADEIAWAKTHNIQKSAGSAPRRTSTVKTAIAPLIQTQWDQGAPYNNQCPYYYYNKSTGEYNYSITEVSGYEHCVTGCVATAMAQVMYYNQWPQSATTAIPSYTWKKGDTTIGTLGGLEATTFDWNNMIPIYTGSESDAQNTAVATLMKYCGYSVQMNYGASSGASSSLIADALKNKFGYESTTTYLERSFYSYANWIEIIYNELDHDRVVLYSGTSSGGGHAFVCDGYQTEDYFHINWGWGGTSDGYFKMTTLNPSEQGAGGSSSDDGYHYGQGAVVGIQKNGGTGTVLDAPTSNYSLSLNSISIDQASVVKGTTVNITCNITNSGSDDYDGDIWLWCNSLNLFAGSDFIIPAGTTKNCVISYTPTGYTGTINIKAYKPDGGGYYSPIDGSKSVGLTVTSGGGDSQTSNITLGRSIVVDNSEGNNFYGTVFKGTLTVTNPESDKVFYGIYQFDIYENDNTLRWRFNDYITIPASGSLDIPFALTGTTPNTNYMPYLVYVKNGSWTAWDHVGTYTCQPGVIQYSSDGTMSVTKVPDSKTINTSLGTYAVNVVGAGITSATSAEPNCIFIKGSDDADIFGATNVITYDGSTYSAGNITLTDGSGFYSPVDFTAENIEFNYAFTVAANGTNGWNTIMLPFDVTKVTYGGVEKQWFNSSEDTGKHFWLKSFTSDAASNVYFDFVSGTTMTANTPYIVAFPGDLWGAKWDMSKEQIRFIGESTTVHKGGTLSTVTGSNYRFIGNTVRDNTENIYTINADGNSFVLNASGGCAPFRAFFKPGSFDRTVTSLGIGSGTNTTGLNEVRVQKKDVRGEYFDLQGRKVTNPTKGLYIVNGKKVIVK